MGCALVWFRNDLRLDDNPALRAALDAGLVPIPVYIHAPEEHGDWAPGAASDARRHRALTALDRELRARGSALHVLAGPSLALLQVVAAATGAEAVFWNRRYEPALEARVVVIKRTLRKEGLRAESHNGALLFEPWQIETKQGDPYKVFTAFWKSAQAQWRLTPTWDAPAELPACADAPHGRDLDSLRLQPALGWDAGFWPEWQPGEAGARARLAGFIADAAADYRVGRDFPARASTSKLSPHLHFGEIAPWRIVHAMHQADLPDSERAAYIRELGWREFAHHVLHHFPHSADSNFNPRFDEFPWVKPHPRVLDAWQRGETGVPIVDAGMRELWASGWMHNRVRMIVGSFLTKHLRLHWRHGADWFWDTLVDADLANNSMGWQWVAGTGVDAAPYFRVFNPLLQAQRFDAKGEYIARWIPELAPLPAALRLAPWTDPAAVRRVTRDYPTTPIIGLAEGRDAALAAFANMRAG